MEYVLFFIIAYIIIVAFKGFSASEGFWVALGCTIVVTIINSIRHSTPSYKQKKKEEIGEYLKTRKETASTDDSDTPKVVYKITIKEEEHPSIDGKLNDTEIELVDGIVPWNPGYFPEISSANDEQQKCYLGIRKNIYSGKYVDIEDQDSYLYYMAEELQRNVYSTEDKSKLEKLLSNYNNVISLYSEEKPKVISYFYRGFLAVNYKLNRPKEDLKSALSSYINFCLKNGIFGASWLIIPQYIKLMECNEHSYVSPILLPVFAGTNLKQHLTDIGKKHYSDVLDAASDILNADFSQTGTNYLFKMYDFHEGGLENNDYFGLSTCSSDPSQSYGEKIPSMQHLLVPTNNEKKHIAFVKNLLREAENMVRVASGLQRIGEGWVSETLLYQQLRKAFNDEKTVQHASPAFLGRQHYDIYFPEYKIAIEYQGDQHFKPIDYFGGEEAFQHGQDRDKKKRDLSKKNKVTQIDVLPGYDLKKLVEQIAKAMGKKLTSTQLEKRVAIASKTKVKTGISNDINESIKKINTEVNSSLDADEELTRRMNELLSKREKSWYAGKDFINEVSHEEAMRMISDYRHIAELSKINPEESNRQAKELFDSGYRAPAIYERMAINYHKMKEYDKELDLLLQAKVDYGYNFDERIKKLLKRS